MLQALLEKKKTVTRLQLYTEAGVREYWLVDSTHYVVTVFDLKNGSYVFRKIYSSDEAIPSISFPECRIDLSEFFTEWTAQDVAAEAAYEAGIVRIR